MNPQRNPNPSISYEQAFRQNYAERRQTSSGYVPPNFLPGHNTPGNDQVIQPKNVETDTPAAKAVRFELEGVEDDLLVYLSNIAEPGKSMILDSIHKVILVRQEREKCVQNFTRFGKVLSKDPNNFHKDTLHVPPFMSNHKDISYLCDKLKAEYDELKRQSYQAKGAVVLGLIELKILQADRDHKENLAQQFNYSTNVAKELFQRLVTNPQYKVFTNTMIEVGINDIKENTLVTTESPTVAVAAAQNNHQSDKQYLVDSIEELKAKIITLPFDTEEERLYLKRAKFDLETKKEELNKILTTFPTTTTRQAKPASRLPGSYIEPPVLAEVSRFRPELSCFQGNTDETLKDFFGEKNPGAKGINTPPPGGKNHGLVEGQGQEQVQRPQVLDMLPVVYGGEDKITPFTIKAPRTYDRFVISQPNSVEEEMASWLHEYLNFVADVEQGVIILRDLGVDDIYNGKDYKTEDGKTYSCFNYNEKSNVPNLLAVEEWKLICGSDDAPIKLSARVLGELPIYVKTWKTDPNPMYTKNDIGRLLIWITLYVATQEWDYKIAKAKESNTPLADVKYASLTKAFAKQKIRLNRNAWIANVYEDLRSKGKGDTIPNYTLKTQGEMEVEETPPVPTAIAINEDSVGQELQGLFLRPKETAVVEAKIALSTPTAIINYICDSRVNSNNIPREYQEVAFNTQAWRRGIYHCAFHDTPIKTTNYPDVEVEDDTSNNEDASQDISSIYESWNPNPPAAPVAGTAEQKGNFSKNPGTNQVYDAKQVSLNNRGTKRVHNNTSPHKKPPLQKKKQPTKKFQKTPDGPPTGKNYTTKTTIPGKKKKLQPPIPANTKVFNNNNFNNNNNFYKQP